MGATLQDDRMKQFQHDSFQFGAVLELDGGYRENANQTVCVGDIEAQTERLFLNISKLLEDGDACLTDMKYFLVYLRDISDRDVVDAYMKAHFPQIPYIILEARVCRPTWLIEVEGMAVK